MATYTPQSEIPVPLSPEARELIKFHMAGVVKSVGSYESDTLVAQYVIAQLEKVLPRGEAIHNVPQYEKYF